MKENYTISKYVYVWHSDENGTKGELLMEAQMSPKIRGEKSLVVRTIEPLPKEVDLVVDWSQREEDLAIGRCS